MVKSDDIEKRWRSTADIAEILDEHSATIRYWEAEFQIRIARKGKTKVRQFDNEDLEKFKWIQNLTRQQGYTIWGAKRQIDLHGWNGDINFTL